MKIGVIFTGGTIGSRQSDQGIAPTDDSPRRLLSLYRERTGDGSDFPTAEPYTILSENLSFAHITALAACVREKAGEWDGMIVTHGTDTLQYTAAALSYLLGLKYPPTVLVSANYPLEDPRSNGLDNFCGAVDFLRSTPDAKGTYISYRNEQECTKIHRASRLLPHRTFDDALFSVGGPVAEIIEGKVYPVAEYSEQADGQPPMNGNDLIVSDGRILFLNAHPGMRYPALDGAAAVLIGTYHSGTLATAGSPLRRFAMSAKKQNVPVFLAGTQVSGTAYESGNLFDRLGLIPLPPISPIAAYMKLCLAFSDGKDFNTALALPLGGDL
ncbi:MAG: asparaginase [Clostridia bacterium]|nr:asparaginase [Clostridia bacterium]